MRLRTRDEGSTEAARRQRPSSTKAAPKQRASRSGATRRQHRSSIVDRIVAKGAAEAQAKLPLLRHDRIKLQAELTGEREQGRRLANAIADGSGSDQFVADALKGGGGARSLLGAAVGGPGGGGRAAGAKFADAEAGVLRAEGFHLGLDSLNAEEQARLARLVIREIVYDRRDKSEGEIRWRFWPLKTAPPQDPEVLRFPVRLELRGGRDSKASWGADPGESERIDDHSISYLAAADESDDSRANGTCTIAPNAAWEAIATPLARAEEDWLDCSEPRKLRRALHDILRMLDE
jgi:hypothetical protein